MGTKVTRSTKMESLEFTALSAKYGSKFEEAFLSTLVKIGLWFLLTIDPPFSQNPIHYTLITFPL